MTDFKKILIANRGEIAIRIMRAANEMGKKTVAVFAEEGHVTHVRALQHHARLAARCTLSFPTCTYEPTYRYATFTYMQVYTFL